MIFVLKSVVFHLKKSVAPNVVSLAEAYIFEGLAWPRVVYLNETFIGFVMLRLELSNIKSEDQPAYYIWRMMISRVYQNQGYGKQVIDKITKKVSRRSSIVSLLEYNDSRTDSTCLLFELSF